MTYKSPFLVFQNLISPDECAELSNQVRVEPIKNDLEEFQSSERFHDESEKFIFNKIRPIIPKIEEHFTNFTYRGTEKIRFQQFPVTNGNPAEQPHCENAVYKRKKWLKVKDRDLTGILWLKDYQDKPPFYLESQVYGGKLEFPVYNFGFQPQQGTLVIYPACERFISLTSAILVGELVCARINMAAEGIWLYDPLLYPGDFRAWFTDVV